MKSSPSELASRGFLAMGYEDAFKELPLKDRFSLLYSCIATERTLGARLLSTLREKNVVNHLIIALAMERKLYTKIEICNALVSIGAESVKPLIKQLGRIGTNQHKGIHNKDFRKDSYPLPRDIASRTLSQIGPNALPELLEALKTNSIIQLSEAIDAIGHICFYSNDTIDVLTQLIDCYNSNASNDLIRWKITRAMSALPDSIQFLESIMQSSDENNLIKREASRSLRLLCKTTS